VSHPRHVHDHHVSSSRPSVAGFHHFSAPTLATRSPPKPLSTASSRDSSNKAELSSHRPADGHLPRLKQHHQQSNNIPPTTNLANVTTRSAIASNPDPTKWAVKGTSVQAANAIHQAAMALNPKDSWASSSRTIVPRSTSVEYEKETQSTSTRRLNPPPSRNAPPPSRSAGAASKLAKQASVRYAPDSEGEDGGEATQGRHERAKTPLESVIDLAKRTAFYLRQRSTEPDVGSPEQGQNGHHDGNNNTNINESYDYAAEERDFQVQSASAKARKASNAALHKRGRISADNKAYRPTQSDLEQSDDEITEEGKRRRRKARKNMIGPLTTLPVIDQEKRRRRRSRTKADGVEDEDEAEGGGEGEEEDSGSDREVSPQVRRPTSSCFPPFTH
jgi:SUN domain-containing protein 1/2